MPPTCGRSSRSGCARSCLVIRACPRRCASAWRSCSPPASCPRSPAPAWAVPVRSCHSRTRSAHWPAGDALAEHGMDEFGLGPREGHALLAGVPGATALSVLRLAQARALAARMEAAAALSIVAARASRDPYREECGRGDAILGQVLRRLRRAVGEVAEPGALQAPVS